jgi:hypothetical protein
MIPKLDELRDTIEEYESEGLTYVDEYMCSAYCPCQSSAQSLYTDPKYSANVFNSGTLNFPVVSTFLMDCYDQAQGVIDADFEVDERIVDIIAYMEETFDCSGVSTVPNFYVARDHMEGPPTKSCGEAVDEAVGDSVIILAIVMIANSFLNFLIWNV